MPEAAAAYDVSLADPGRDRAEILELGSTVLDDFTSARYEKYFERNPYGPPLVVAARARANGELVGMAALHPQQMRVDGEILTGAVAGDFAVHPEHRAFGPALALQRELTRAADERGLRLAVGIPDGPAAGVLRRVGYRRAGVLVPLVRMLRPAGAEAVARGRALPGAFAASLRTRRLRAALAGHSVREPESFAAPLESLLAQLEPVGISVQPSRAFLEWRFDLDVETRPGRFSILAVTRAETPVAYAVSRDGGAVRHVVDLAWLDTAGLAAIVAAIIERSREAGLAAVGLSYLGGNSDLAAVLTRFGFFPARQPGRAVWCRGDDADALADPSRWLLFASAFDE
jgi:GNAT superfamily N-acetyltransferase